MDFRLLDKVVICVILGLEEKEMYVDKRTKREIGTACLETSALKYMTLFQMRNPKIEDVNIKPKRGSVCGYSVSYNIKFELESGRTVSFAETLDYD